MVTGKTKLVGILGWPVEHSLSPAIHNAAFSLLKLDYTYVPLPVMPHNLAAAISGIKALGLAGVNVTIPHKVAIIPLLDELDKSAELVGAVNTVVIREDGRTIGYNTDAEGFVNSLKFNNVKIENSKIAILGAGGASRAVACGLLNNGAQQIVVGVRNPDKADSFASLFHDTRLTGLGWLDNEFTNWLENVDILINTTPLGMHPKENSEPPVCWESLHHKAVVADIVYNPHITKFLKSASNYGHKIVTGDGMLVEQGALAFELWMKCIAPRQEMYKIVKGFIE